MVEKPVARVGDPGSHGGVITSGASTIVVNGRPIARVGDIYACPKHGPNPIVTGAPHVFGQGQLVAHVGSKTACGAEIISGSPDTFVGTPAMSHSQYLLTEFLYETTFVEFQLLNENDEPIPNEVYIITLPNGKETNGVLDEKGFVHLDDVPRGRCMIRFPALEEFEEVV